MMREFLSYCLATKRKNRFPYYRVAVFFVKKVN